MARLEAVQATAGSGNTSRAAGVGSKADICEPRGDRGRGSTGRTADDAIRPDGISDFGCHHPKSGGIGACHSDEMRASLYKGGHAGSISVCASFRKECKTGSEGQPLHRDIVLHRKTQTCERP